MSELQTALDKIDNATRHIDWIVDEAYEVCVEAARHVANEAHRSERCPNQWACKRGCSCHRLSEDDMAADLAAHYMIVTVSWREDMEVAAALTPGDTK
jgi:hypothetical protein